MSKNLATNSTSTGKLITLNIWGGQIKEPLINFVKKNQDVDIFCLQEIYHKASHGICADNRAVELSIFSELSGALPQHKKYFAPTVNGTYGIGMFISHSIRVSGQGEVCIYNNPHYVGFGHTHKRVLQWTLCERNAERFYVINVHGLWNGEGKSDSPARIKQSKKIRKFIDSLDTPVILCGDFNLTPGTQSMKILSDSMENLIQIYNVTSTRTSYYKKNIHYADYIITSSDIWVEAFKVLPDEVSDHAPLYLEFQL